MSMTVDYSAGFNTDIRPGVWQFIIPATYEFNGEERPGIETHKLEGRQRVPLTTNAGDPKWSITLKCQDDHPEAPVGMIVWDTIVGGNNNFGKKKLNTLIRAMGLRLPNGHQLAPEELYGRPFKAEVQPEEYNGKTRLKVKFANFYPVTHKSIPGDIMPSKSSAGGAGNNNGSSSSSAMAAATDGALDDCPF